MQTSAKGVAALELEEGVVLRAYLCPAGRWTIGAGLTAASGVVKPHAGMVITREMATNLLQLALRKSYEPEVAKAMPAAPQTAFDAGVSFHFNTGAIGRATWVKRWRAKAARAAIVVSLLAWNKGGGKVLPGLTARREREAAMLLDGVYRGAAAQAPSAIYATWGLVLTPQERVNVKSGLQLLGYEPGDMIGVVLRDAAMAFQRNQGLTVDGIIGRATLATLQRQLDARSKVKTAAPIAAAPAATAALPHGTSDLTDALLALPHATPILIGAGALYAALFAWRYRDAVAAMVNAPLPRLAAFLRSF